MKAKGFTLIELMIVVVIVAILAAVVVPLLISRVEKAKQSEGKAIAGQIATAVRAYVAENSEAPAAAPALVADLGFRARELDGKYYQQTGSSVTGVGLSADGQVSYVITVNARVADLPDVVLECTSANSYNPTFSDGTTP